MQRFVWPDQPGGLFPEVGQRANMDASRSACLPRLPKGKSLKVPSGPISQAFCFLRSSQTRGWGPRRAACFPRGPKGKSCNVPCGPTSQAANPSEARVRADTSRTRRTHVQAATRRCTPPCTSAGRAAPRGSGTTFGRARARGPRRRSTCRAARSSGATSLARW